MHLTIYGVFEGIRCLMVGSTERPLFLRVQEYRRLKWFDTNIHVHKILWEGDINSEDYELLRFIRATKETVWIARMGTWFPKGKNKISPLNQMLGMRFGYEELARLGGMSCPKEARSRGGKSACAIIHKKYPHIAINGGLMLARYSRNRTAEQRKADGRKGGLAGGEKGGRAYWRKYGVPRGTHEDRVRGGSIGGAATKKSTNGRKSNGGYAYWRRHLVPPGTTEDRIKGGKNGGRRYVELYGAPKNVPGLGGHKRWHINRGISSSICRFCSVGRSTNE